MESLLREEGPQIKESKQEVEGWIGGYQLGERLGEGGGGSVHSARRSGSGAVVALKLLHARVGGADGEDRLRTWRELEILKRVRLPGVPRVLDWGEDAGRSYIVTELIEGVPLDKACSKLSRAEAVELLARTADVVQEVHEQQVIHRDLKPSNILVTASGSPVVLDFGMASVLEGRAETTITWNGAVHGTPAFMAPEQARIDGRSTTRTDVFGLGAAAVLALTGRTLYAADKSAIETLREVAAGNAHRIRELDPTMPQALAAVLEKATAARPGDRYSSAADFARDLRRWLAGEAVEAVPPRRWQRVLRRAEQHPILATGAVCAAMLGSTILGMWGYTEWWWWKYSEPVRIEFAPMGRTVEVIARSGRVIESIRLENGVIQTARFFDSAEAADRPMVLIAVREDDLDQVDFALQGFDATTGERLLKWHPAYPEWAPPPTNNHNARPGAFRCAQVRVINEPTIGGNVIATLYQYTGHSLSCLAIHDFAGTLLQQVWHDGYLYDVARFSDVPMYVVVGVNSDGYWADRGFTASSGVYSPHPIVAFAVELGSGEKSGVVMPGSPMATAEPAWYRCLLPAHAAARYAVDTPVERRMRHDKTIDGREELVLWVDRRHDRDQLEWGLFVEWVVMRDGRFLARELPSTWAQRVAGVPSDEHPHALEWGELPPRSRLH